MEYSIETIFEEIQKRSDCTVIEPCGIPLEGKNIELPYDLIRFYEKCGGVVFENSVFKFEIVSPQNVQLVNPIIIGEICEDDISSKWYTICRDCENNYISIDLEHSRIGRCYDSFWDRHGVPGDCSVVALSFSELLYHLLYDQESTQPYWMTDKFTYIGDAYD